VEDGRSGGGVRGGGVEGGGGGGAGTGEEEEEEWWGDQLMEGGREPQDQPLQDSEEETADRPLAEPRGIQMQATRRAALSSLSRFEMRQ